MERPILINGAYVYREKGWQDALAGREKRLEEAREAGHASDYLIGYRAGERQENESA